MKHYSLQFGALAPPMSEQLPMLSSEQAGHFDADNKAIARLRVRGYISDGELTKIHRRCAAAIGEEISRSAKIKGEQP